VFANPSWLAKEHNLGQKKTKLAPSCFMNKLKLPKKTTHNLFSILVSVTNLTMFIENQLNDDVNREATNMH
jgi:hypothetical protein